MAQPRSIYGTSRYGTVRYGEGPPAEIIATLSLNTPASLSAWLTRKRALRGMLSTSVTGGLTAVMVSSHRVRLRAAGRTTLVRTSGGGTRVLTATRTTVRTRENT